MAVTSTLIDRCRGPMGRMDEQDELVGEILLEDTDQESLRKLAADRRCAAIFRCAALDRYLERVLARPGDALWPEVFHLLENLTEPASESDLDVRLAATQWRAELAARNAGGASQSSTGGAQVTQAVPTKEAVQTRGAACAKGAVRTRGAMPAKGAESQGQLPDWRQRAAQDPSPQVRWLASLGQ